MSGYRFCRPDDIPLLVQAVNSVYNIHFPDEPECTLSSFKQEIKYLNLWSSSCMISLEGTRLIGVCIGCKRLHETLIHKIGVHPEHLHVGHATHMLESLAQKLSVLGPPRIIAEVPSRCEQACGLFLKLGYTQEVIFADYALEEPLEKLDKNDIIVPITLEDIIQSDILLSGDFSWIRTTETLTNAKEKLQGQAIVSTDRIEAYVLYEQYPEDNNVNVLRAYCFDKSSSNVFFKSLFRMLSTLGFTKISLPRVSKDEICFSYLEDIGFKKGDEYLRFAKLASNI
jgi:GNAT superfamily N-acetyltransferase